MTPDVIVFVVSVRDDGLDAAVLAEKAGALFDEAVAAARQADLDRPGTIARLKDDLRRIVPSVPPVDSGRSRLIEVTELRITQGDIATASVGLAANKELTFAADGSSCRIGFQLLRTDRFLRSVPPP